MYSYCQWGGLGQLQVTLQTRGIEGSECDLSHLVIQTWGGGEYKRSSFGWGRISEAVSGNWITMQAKLVRAARRDHGRSLGAAEQGTEWSQVLGKEHQLDEDWGWLWALGRV